MVDVFTILQAGVVVFLAVLLLIASSNLRRLRRLGEYPSAASTPRISICVPVRNEEASIRACIESLAQQDYPLFEVLVLDDGSTDQTPAILAEIASRYPQVRVIQGQSLPAGWLGKHWACHQIAQLAAGDLLLFTDADTRHHPLTLRYAADALAAEDADLLAGLPRQEVKTWAEKLLIPIIPFSILSLLPLNLAYRLQLPLLSAAIGQFMLFRRTAYERIGGHAAIRADVVDDLALARRIKSQGLRWRMVDAISWVTCRMYHTPQDVIDGLSKNLYAVFNQKSAVHLFVWLWMLIVAWLPLVVLAASLAGVPIAAHSVWLAVIGIVASLALWVINYHRLEFSIPLALLYPLTILSCVLLALRSMWMTLRGETAWKGRRLTVAPSIPEPDGVAGLDALKAMWRQHSIMAALSVFHHSLGDVFRIKLGAFQPVVMAGPAACHFVAIEAKDQLSWRPERDPVTKLLRGGLLVQDGECHDGLRRLMNPALHRQKMAHYVEAMYQRTDHVLSGWGSAKEVDALVEMRRAALLILMETLFKVDFAPRLDSMLPVILDVLAYISPGTWLVWPAIPRGQYTRSLQEMDAYLYEIIRQRRASNSHDDDLLSLLVRHPDLSDDLIRDQLLTMLIAGHDTSTMLLTWTIIMLGQHPEVMNRVRREVDDVLGANPPSNDDLSRLTYLDQVIRETLRLYPPIHMGNRIAAQDIEFQGNTIPSGTRVAYSIYLTHRDPAHWANPDQFDPNRFEPLQARQIAPYTYLPFGGGARNCIGMTYAMVEAKVVLVRLIQMFEFDLLGESIHMHMGATLEPHPGVKMQVRKRSYS